MSSPAVVDGTVYVKTRNPDSTVYALTGRTSSPATTTETAVPDSLEVTQQQGTSATDITSTSEDTRGGISVFSYLNKSSVPAAIIGGVTTILGLGGGYAAYRRSQSGGDNQDE